MPSALAIDVGEWFHDAALAAHVSPRHWRRLFSCGEAAFARARAGLAASGARATWFVTGANAGRAAPALRELAAAGHEIAFAAAPLALGANASAEERERAQRAWSRELAAVEAAAAQAVRGVLMPWPSDEQAWWREWFARAGLAYAAAPPRAGEAPAVRTFAGRAVDTECFAAWRLVPEQPRLVGLPRAVFAAHYDRVAADGAPLAQALARAGGTIARALALAPAPPPARVQDAPPPATTAPGAPRLAIVVPLKDEETGIASLAAELDEVARALADVAACELVLVDDGSTDRTWPLLQEHFARRAGASLVRHERNRGVAAAIRTGLAATTAELAASIDGDLSYDPMELRAMLPLAAHADVVTASPYHARGGVANVPRWRLALSRALSFAYRVLLRSPIRTWTSCFRVYRRAAVVDLPLANEGFLGTAELLVRVLRRGGRVAEHPCVLEARLFGVSKMKVLRTIGGHLGLLWRVAWRRIA
jgi:hypothetical protein